MSTTITTTNTLTANDADIEDVEDAKDGSVQSPPYLSPQSLRLLGYPYPPGLLRLLHQPPGSRKLSMPRP